MTSPAELLARFGSPLYVYDEGELRARCRELQGTLGSLPSSRLLYAMKANANAALLRIIRAEGFGIDAVSVGEMLHALRSGFPADDVSFTANNVGDAELTAARERGVAVTVDGLAQLERYARVRPGDTVGLRVNPAIGGGHHDHVITGGPESKFGVDRELLQDALALATRHGVRIDSLQHHIGSGILESQPLLDAASILLDAARVFPHVETVDFGGGFGIAYRPDEDRFDLEAYAAALRPLLVKEARKHRPLRVRFEPGRYVVATSGTLYVTVTSVKRGCRHTFVGTDSGMNHLVRPALYGSYHRLENVSNPAGATERVTVVGNICESGDVFARDRALPACREGDVLAIRDAGAYGYSMASTYNLRPRPAEVLLAPDGARLIRPRDRLEDLGGSVSG